MASKGRWSPRQSLAETIYWHRTLPRETRDEPWRAPTADEVAHAWSRAQAVAARYRRMKQRMARKAA